MSAFHRVFKKILFMIHQGQWYIRALTAAIILSFCTTSLGLAPQVAPPIDSLTDEIDSSVQGPALDLDKIKIKKKSPFRYGFDFGNSRIESKDRGTGATAAVISDLNFGIHFGVDFYVNKEIQIFGKLSDSIDSYRQFKSLKLVNAQQNLFTIGLGGRYKFGRKNLIQLFFESGQEAFLKAESPVVIGLQKISIPKINAYLKHDFSGNKMVGLLGKLGAKYFLGTDNDGISTEDGYGYSVGVEVLSELLESRADLGIEYGKTTISSNLADQYRTEVKMYFDWRF
jgi:hypothetical protein